MVCIFVDPHHGEGDVDASGLSVGVKALILGAQCSVEVVRANSSNDQIFKTGRMIDLDGKELSGHG